MNDDYKGLNDYVHGCSDEELLSFSKVLDTISKSQLDLVIKALDYKSREMINKIDIINLES
jgi:hypothetical protein